MDLLHSGRLDGFCLVSSDSDFTRLASRLREQGADVYGFGMQKTPESFWCRLTRSLADFAKLVEPFDIIEGAQPLLRPLHLVVREMEFCGQRLAGDFSRRTRENGRNSVRRPRHASLTDRNCEGFCRPGNRPGLSGLYGGAEGIQTDGHRDLTPSGRGIRQNLSGGRFGHPSVQYDAQHFTFPLAPGSDLSSAKTTQ